MSELRKIKDIHLLEKKQRTEPNVVCRVKILERLCQQAIEKNQLFDNDYIQGQLNLIDSLYQLSDCPPAEHLYHMMNRAQWLHNT